MFSWVLTSFLFLTGEVDFLFRYNFLGADKKTLPNSENLRYYLLDKNTENKNGCMITVILSSTYFQLSIKGWTVPTRKHIGTPFLMKWKNMLFDRQLRLGNILGHCFGQNDKNNLTDSLGTEQKSRPIVKTCFKKCIMNSKMAKNFWFKSTTSPKKWFNWIRKINNFSQS